MSASESRIVAVVTGANSGVGFGLCHRLLLQLADRGYPPKGRNDLPPNDAKEIPLSFSAAESLTLVLACRNMIRAETARLELLRLLDSHIRHSGLKDSSKTFRSSLIIEAFVLDLSSVESVFHFCAVLQQRHAYISHLFLNAGTGDYIGFNKLGMALQIWQQGLVTALTTPTYQLQRSNVLTDDGFGLVWQSNVFGHYMMIRLLSPLLIANPLLDSRVIWTSSMGAAIGEYASEDWQLTVSNTPYEASKLQQDFLSIQLDEQFSNDDSTRHVRSFLFEPGVLQTNIVALGPLTAFCARLTLHLARLLSSPYHVVAPYKGAVGGITAALDPIEKLHVAGSPIKYCSRVSRWGTEVTAEEPVTRWEENHGEAAVLMDHCEQLFNALRAKHQA